MVTPTLTFGIELEFLCLRPGTLFGSAGGAIYDTLLANNIPATGHEDIEEDIIEILPSYTAGESTRITSTSHPKNRSTCPKAGR